MPFVVRVSLPLLALLLGLTATPPCHAQPAKIAFGADDWPWWRGPDRNGHADPKQQIPLKWSETENVIWKATVPGRGHGSPIVVGEQVVLATADEQAGTQSVVCFDRKTGKLTWQTEVHKGGLVKGGNGKSSHASSTAACDGERFFINFLNSNAIYTTALSRKGEILWQKKITDYVLHQGFGSSPAVYDSLVIVSADNKGGKGAVAALDRATGDVVWKHERPATPNYCSPIIVKIDGKDQLIMLGCDLVASFEPRSGKKLWEMKGATTECVTSTVTDGKLIYTSGGFPRNHVAAVAADGSMKVVWENTSRIYVPSFISHNGYLFAVLDAGMAVCWKADTGKELWKSRIDGPFSGSVVRVGDNLIAVNEMGDAFIWKASPDAFTLVGQNRLGTEMFATPTICGGRIYLRTASKVDGKRVETLYCVGAP
jgi:outer membrane protein assembly factor BamB